MKARRPDRVGVSAIRHRALVTLLTIALGVSTLGAGSCGSADAPISGTPQKGKQHHKRKRAHHKRHHRRHRSHKRTVPPSPPPAPTPAPPPPPPPPAKPACDPNYKGACLDPNASDYDCAGGSGDGPKYTGTVQVVGADHFDLDRDGDGIACDQ
jgi:hypothetical protein